MIITVSLNPAIDRTIYVKEFRTGTLNRVTESRDDPGGKGINVSKLLSVFGIPNIAFAVVGGENGKKLERECLSAGMQMSVVPVDGETRINTKVIDMSSSVTTEINERGPVLDRETSEHIFQKLNEEIGNGDTVVFTGSLPKGAPADLYGKWTEKLREKKVKVILDASGEALAEGLQTGVYAVKPNREELEQLTDCALNRTEDIVSAAEKLSEKGISRIIVSLGSEGAVFVFDGKKYFAPALKVNVKSTVGAGDSMVAALLACEETGKSVEETIRYIMASASAAVMCKGSDTPSRDTVASLLDSVEIRSL